MGLFDFIRGRLARRRIVRAFGSYVDAATVQKILDNRDLPLDPPSSRTIDFVLALVRDEELDAIPGLLVGIVALAWAHRGFPDSVTGPLVLVVFGAPTPDPESAAHRAAFIAGLVETLGDRAKILHGRAPALVGLVAGPYGPYGVAMAGFGGLLRELTGLEFGQVREAGL